MITSFGQFLYRLTDPNVRPTPFDVVARLTVGTLFFSGSAAINAYLLKKVTPLVLSPLTGAILGGTFTIVNTTTTLANKVYEREIGKKRSEWRAKMISDLFYSGVASFIYCYLQQLPLSPASIAILLPTMLTTAESLFRVSELALQVAQYTFALIFHVRENIALY
jgi:hypothetical protein